jgi:hypothetical protein
VETYEVLKLGVDVIDAYKSENAALKQERDRYKGALEKIADPGTGGHAFLIAKEALTPPSEFKP